MAGTSILKEFLVKLGFKVDGQGYNDFQNRLGATVHKFEELGKVATLAGTAIAVSVKKTSDNLEKLYYQSQRAGTSVGNLLSLRFGGSQSGVGADELASSVERMASSIRSNPGMLVFFKQLQLPLSNDNVKNFESLLSKLRIMDAQGQGVLARLIGAQFGYDEQTLNTLFKNWPAYLAGRKEEERILKESGVNAQQLAEKSVAFNREWRVFLAHVETLAFLFTEHLLPFFDKVVVGLTKAANGMFALDRATEGWSTTLGGVLVSLGGVLSAMKLLKGLGGIFGIGEGAAAAAGSTGAAAAGGVGIGGALATGGLIGLDALLAVHDAKMVKKLYEAYGGTNALRNAGKSIQDYIIGKEGFRTKSYPDASGRSIGYGHFIQPGEDFSKGITKSEALELLQKDIDKAATAVRKLVTVPLNSNQFEALTDFVYNVGGGKKGLAGSTLLKKLNSGDYSGAAEQFARFNHVMTNSGYQVSDDLTKRRLSEKNLFNRPITVTQDTTIHIATTGNARETASEVEAAKRRADGDLVRNMSGLAVR